MDTKKPGGLGRAGLLLSLCAKQFTPVSRHQHEIGARQTTVKFFPSDDNERFGAVVFDPFAVMQRVRPVQNWGRSENRATRLRVADRFISATEI